MKNNNLAIILIAIILTSCGNAETKTDVSTTVIENKTDSSNAIVTPKESEGNVNSKTAVKEGQPPATTAVKSEQTRGIQEKLTPGNNEILAHIDQHLISTPQYTASPSGGFINCSVRVTNTLTEVTFQKALIELTILKPDGSLLRTDYYTVINVEPGGGTKIVLIPDNNQGVKIVTHIIKVKSNELTNGEFVLTGSRFIAN